MLCLADRNSFGYKMWKMACPTGADLVWRLKKNQILPCERRLSDGSYLSTAHGSQRVRRQAVGGRAGAGGEIPSRGGGGGRAAVPSGDERAGPRAGPGPGNSPSSTTSAGKSGRTSTNVCAGTTKGVFRSPDGGNTLERAGLQWSNRTWTLVFDVKTEPPTRYFGGEDGVLKTTTGGQWWKVTGPQSK